MKEVINKELLPYIGSINSLYRIEPVTFSEGSAYFTRGLLINNGLDLDLTVLTDRGMDIPYLRFKGKNIGFPSKNGIKSPFLFQEKELRGFLQQFFVGFLTTVGFVHGGPPQGEYGLHGVANQLMAERVSYDLIKEDDEVIIKITGDLRESVIFGPNILLHRTYFIHTQKNRIVVADELVNEGFQKSEVKMLYHMNFGYPMLSEHAYVETNATRIEPRDENAAKGINYYQTMHEPKDVYPEQCFFHQKFSEQKAKVSLINKALNFEIDIQFDRDVFPLLCQWKNLLSGDYCLGLEPSFPGVLENDLKPYILNPGERKAYSIVVDFLEKKDQNNERK